jgi:putative ABC transport system permease protein
MFPHYLLTVTRNIGWNKWVSAIKIGGLAVGLACSLLILLYLKNELGYDRFHQNRDHLYQLTCIRSEQDGTSERFAIAAQVQGPAFKQEVPEIKEDVRVMQRDVVIKNEDDLFNENATWVDPHFFDVFSFPLKTGSPRAVLAGYHNAVLTESAARKYFGSAEAVGRQLLLEINGRFEPFVVSGIALDPPDNSSIRFTVLLSFPYYQQINPDNGWMWVSFPTYFLLPPDADIAAVNKKLQQVYRSRAQDEIDLNTLAGYHNRFDWALLPMTSMHFRSGYKGTPDASDPIYAYILSGIALFVLLIACINFINLAIAQSLKRSREIGIRKVIGGRRGQLLLQFLGESMVMSGLAFVLAIGLAAVVLPAFGTLAGKSLRLGSLVDWSLAGELLALVLATGFVAGLYPAVVLSGFRPVEALGGTLPGMGGNRLAQVLVVIQFMLATVLITSTLFIYSQFRLLTTTSTGYDDKDLLAFTIPGGVGNKSVMDYYQRELSNVAGVVRAGYQNIGKFGGKTVVNGKEFPAQYVRIDNRYPATIGVPVVHGRAFSAAYPADTVASALVNETLVRRAGLGDATGKTIDYLNLPGWGIRKLTIVGVLRDFHYTSLKEPVEPMVFLQDNAIPLGKMLLRLRPADVPATLVALDKRFHQLDPDRPFVYEFADEVNRRAYEPEARWGHIIATGAGITVLVAVTGLFGLSLFTIQKRKKEISVRKVLGAEVWQLAWLIASDFGRLVLLAFLIGIPVSYRMMWSWLQSYPYRISLSWWRFGLVGLVVLSIALLTVSYHAIRAAVANPVHSLKNE